MEPKRQRMTPLPLDKAVEYMLEECRMVLPGIQALFGFQLIVVFSERFDSALSLPEKRLHLAAIVLVALAIAWIMTPAALHRLAEPQSVTERFLMTCSRLILAAMLPLAAAIVLETYLVANALLGQPGLSVIIAIALGMVFVALWWAMPLWRRIRN